ncbi:MAG: hypothetical protein R3D90_10590 [Paracoccaceae bacterium]
MKAIAEYFRDLAAGDRYFGAEPPTPDAAMLHQIAEREIQRRVEAKIQENGVVLRASDPDGRAADGAEARPAVAVVEPTPTPAPAPVAAVAPVAAANVTATTVQDTPAPQAPVAEAAVAEAAAETVTAEATRPSLAPASESAAESVVERLSRLRSEIAAQPAETAMATSPVLSFAIPEYLEDQHADVLDPASEQALADFLPEAEADIASDLPEETEASATPEMAEEEEAFDIAALTEALHDEPAMTKAEAVEPEMAPEALIAESAAEEAPVAMTEEAEAEEAEPLESVPMAGDAEVDLDAGLSDSLRAALDGTDMPDAPVAERAEDPAQDSAEPAEAAQSDEALFASLGAVLGRTDTEAAPDEVTVEEAVVEEATVEEAPVAAETAPEADSAWPEAAEAAPAEAAAVADAAEPTPDQEDETPATEAPTGLELRPGAAEKLQRARARVIRIRRGDELEVKPAEAEAAPTISADAFAEIEEETAAEAPAPQPEVASPAEDRIGALLSAEDEAELQRELAALRLGGEDQDGLSETAAPAVQADPRKPFEGASADESLGRLMQQTDTEMEGSEIKRRQSAIAHLKAAVAATVADRKVTGDTTGTAETVSRLARYRNDLAMVVKAALPGRSAAPEAQAERPAPLVLVSEQRIDRPRPATAPVAQPATGAAAAPIRPRRVTTGGLGMATAADLDLSEDDGDEDLANLFGDSRGFAEFVERVGATSLEQILEASAAYLAGIEGRSHFSRPQLMQHLSAVVPQGSFQREDGLRSFGSLLRNGRFAKVRRGQFTLSDESAYLAEARKIAG